MVVVLAEFAMVEPWFFVVLVLLETQQRWFFNEPEPNHQSLVRFWFGSLSSGGGSPTNQNHGFGSCLALLVYYTRTG